MSTPALVLLAHGTGDAAGRRTLGELLLRLRTMLPGTDVRMSYAGVLRPGLADTVADLRGPVVAVPAFLAAGFHVRVDVPGQLASIAPGRAPGAEVVLAEPLGPDPALLDVALDRVREAGGDPARDTVVLAVAGSTDPVAQEDLRRASATLAARLGRPVPVGYIAGGAPKVADVVHSVRTRDSRVVLLTWLLAPGAFHRRLADAGADAVAEPLGAHPGVAEVIARRYRAACPVGVSVP